MAKDPRETKTTLLVICAVAETLSIDDVQNYLIQLDNYDSFGPFTDPTGYMRDAKKIQRDGRLFSAFLQFRQAIDEVKDLEQAEKNKR